MRIKEIGLLKKKYVQSDTNVEFLKNSGIQCYTSDLARIMGINYSPSTGFGAYWFDGEEQHSKRVPMHYVEANGNKTTSFGNQNAGVRIAIPFNYIEDFNMRGVLKCEFPLMAITGVAKDTIDKLYQEKSEFIIKTGRKYNIDGMDYPEYEVFGVRYIIKTSGVDCVLGDGTTVKRKEPVYLKVEQIPFIVDEQSNLLLSTIIIMKADFNHNRSSTFNNSSLKRYLNNEFLKSINDELEHTAPESLFQTENVEKENRYNFSFDNLTEEDIMEICIKSNVAVFLHGKTGVGKTERMLTLDRDLELVDFGCTSNDGFTGIIAKDFSTKELTLYPPYWYKSLCQKCEAKPNQIHILLLDELTNSKNDSQKVAFEVTLNRTLTNSGFRLVLPENAAVCAAGNESEESRSANKLSEPLFGRFAHVYIDTTSDEWLKWALKRKKEGRTLEYKKQEANNQIHPAIIDFIDYKGDEALRTPYNGKTPNADPRKWALASRALYCCNNPHVLRAFVGKELTAEFIEFCNIHIITIDDVLSGRCTPKNIPNDISIRHFIVKKLSEVDDEHFREIRTFINCVQPELVALFDYEWSKGNSERIMRIFRESSPIYQRVLEINGNNSTN